jgi:hypothetical protein
MCGYELCKTAMGFDDLVTWHASFPLQAVNVLGEQLEQKALFM